MIPNNEKQTDNENLQQSEETSNNDTNLTPSKESGNDFLVPEERQVKKKEKGKLSIKSPKVFVPIIAIVVIIAVVLILVLGDSSDTSSVVLQSVKTINSTASVSNRYSGVVEAQKSENVAFDTTQKLEKLYVKEGDTVKKGDPLFSYNTDSINLSIQKLQVENEISQNSINSNNQQIAQYQNMMSYASASEQITYTADIQELQATNAQLEYNIKTNNAEITVKQKSLDNSTVTAPIDGTIKSIADLSSADSENSTVDASKYITITASGSLRVKGTVGEQNIYEITAGTNVIVRSRVDTNQTWAGTITSVVTQSTESSQNEYSSYYGYSSGESSSKYPFYVDLVSTEGLIMGQHVTIEIDYGQAEVKEGIWLNSAWLTFEGDKAYVLAARTASGPAEKREVTIGEYDANLDLYEIKDGLTEAEYIALPEGNVETSEYPGDDTDYDKDNFDYDISSVMPADDAADTEAYLDAADLGDFSENNFEENDFSENDFSENNFEENDFEEGNFEEE